MQAQTETDSTRAVEDDEPVLVKPNVNEAFKFGVKLGVGAGMLIGSELQNPRPARILNGGAYIRYRFKPHWSIQPELNINFRGSSFNNSSGEYGLIRTFYLDLPVLIVRGLNEQNTSNIIGGIQYSQQLGATLYLEQATLPESNSPKLTPYDVAVMAGMQFHTPFIGFQILAKYGFIDLNDGLLPNLKPANNGGSIHQAGIEVNLLF